MRSVTRKSFGSKCE